MELMEAALEKAGTMTALAKHLGVSQPMLSQIKSGTRPLSPDIAAACAEYLGQNPVEAAVEALAAQAKTKEQAAKWRARLRYVAHAACVVVAFSSAAAFNIESGDASTVLRTKGSEVRILPGAPFCTG